MSGSPEATLSYTDATRGLAPIPACEQGLPTATAEPFFKVSDASIALEGPAFDRQGNLLFVDIYGGRVLRLSPDRVLTTLYADAALQPAGIAVHKDGRIFVAAVGNFTAGRVIALHADGGEPQTIVPASAGYVPNDLVFDSNGGFYFTDFRGTSTSPTGGVHYVSPDFATITAVLPNMSAANGVALSPDGKVLWATEYCAGRLHRVDLKDAVTPARSGTAIPYHFVGRGPEFDACRRRRQRLRRHEPAGAGAGIRIARNTDRADPAARTRGRPFPEKHEPGFRAGLARRGHRRERRVRRWRGDDFPRSGPDQRRHAVLAPVSRSRRCS